MNSGKLGMLLAGLALAAAGTVPIFLLSPLSENVERPIPEAEPSLWPYCSPDATPPPMPATPWPPLPPEGIDGPDGLFVLVDSMVRASEIVPQGEPDGSIQGANVVVEGVLWATRFPANRGHDQMLPVPVGAHLMTAEAEGWAEASAALSSGSEVVLGVLAVPPEKSGFYEDGGYFADFIVTVDADGAEFLGKSPFAERHTGMLNAFLSWKGNPLAGADPVELLRAWNAEAEVPREVYPKEGPIERAWNRFWRHHVTRPDYPPVHTLEGWNAAPPECRVLSVDSPPEVLKGLTEVWIWVKVPPQWLELEDGLCFGIPSFASLGCRNLDPIEGWNYAPFDEAFAVPGKPIEVSIKGRINGQGSWFKKVRIATIPYREIAATGIVLLELDPAWVPPTYEELKADPPERDLATARSLTEAEHEALTDEWPVTPPGDAEA